MAIRKSKKDILNGNVYEQIIIFTIPLIGTYLLQQFYKIADTMILGRYVGKSALAAIGASTSIVNVILNLISGICSGAMIVVAQCYGSKNPEKVKKAVKTGFFIAIILGAILTVSLVLLAKPLLTITGCPSDAIPYSITYLKMYGYSFIPYLVYMMGRYILIATGDSKRSLMFTLIIAAVKVSLDILLTGVLNLEILGVSLATLASYLICAIVVLVIFAITTDIYQYSIKDFGADKDLLKQIIKVGIPVAIQSMFFAFTSLVMQTKINAYGTDTTAAFSAFNDVDNFYWSFSNALANATLTLIGQNYGNKNLRRVYEIVNKAIIVQVIMSLIIGGLDIVFGRAALSMFTPDKEVIEIGYQMLMSVAPYYGLYVLVEILSCLCKGNGDTTSSMIICMIGICAARLAYLTFYNITSSPQIPFGYTVSWIVTSILYVVYVSTSKKYPKLKKDKTQTNF